VDAGVTPAVSSAESAEPAIDQPGEQAGSALADAAAAPAASAPLEQAPSSVATEPLPAVAQTIDIASVMQPSGNTLARLWVLNSEQPAPEFPCLDGPQYGLACAEGEVWTWDELAAFNRPLSLETITPERFSAEALLLGIEGARAWVWTEAGVAQVSLAELAPYWTGRYRFLWHPPQGFTKPLAVGDDSPVVAAVALLFAQLDKQPQPLAGTRFNRALEQRVRMFQKQHALIDDGLVGVQTLLKLNEQLGVDVTAQQARMQLQQSSTQRATE
jgi:general secretion pathway protein A